MKNFINIICVVAALGLYAGPRVDVPSVLEYFNFGKVELIAKPTNTYGFDKSLPAIIKDKTIAQKLTGMCAGLADRIEQDGARSEPRIKYVVNINDLRVEAINVAFDGKKINEVVPQFGSTIGPAFQAEFPDGTVELDATLRKKAVDLFRAISYGCSLVK